MEIDELRRRVFEAHAAGDYRRGLALVDGYRPVDDDERTDTVFWQLCFLSLLGEVEAACGELSGALDAGLWWGPAVLADPDLATVRVDPRWRELEARSLRMAETAVADVTSVVVEPESERAGDMVLFHGAGTNPRMIIDRCRSALDAGYRLVGLQGSEPLASNRWSWPLDRGPEVALGQLASLDLAERPIFVGFSLGAGLAGYLAWTGQWRVAGLVLVAPSFAIGGSPIPNDRMVPVPTLIVGGGHDPRIQNVRRVVSNLAASGVPVRWEEDPELGHDWPVDFDSVLLEALAWFGIGARAPGSVGDITKHP